ncbi:peptide deformylase [Pararhodospirillum oryzae]|uniref:Peptide deformylase n=1 Tax=Pararhodospirillum oryzae TaxID=478448 RepID=A0A512H3X1_9PROT|nr:peptide deformylase [Pararhodospirillum oryzae]GEO80169.1 peptide deformylase [Pararhodospirillum oryzae]
MALLKIARMGTPVLLKPALPVTDFTDPALHRLIEDMAETLADSGGVGLAAPQVHASVRLLVYQVPAERMGPDQGAVPFSVLINPTLDPLGPDTAAEWEGCLSLPGLTGRVPRARSIHYRGFNERGEPVEGEAHGFHARVLQHETDHLDGILYPRRLADPGDFGFVEEIRKALAGRVPSA